MFLAFNFSKIYELYEGLGDPKYLSDFSNIRKLDSVLKTFEYSKSIDLNGLHFFLGSLGIDEQFHLSALLLVAYFIGSMLLILSFRKISLVICLFLAISEFILNNLHQIVFSKDDAEFSNRIFEALPCLSFIGLTFIVALYQDPSEHNDLLDSFGGLSTKRSKFSQRIRKVNYREVKQVLSRS